MQQIRAAFADASRPADDALVCHDCPECHALGEDLHGRTPDELADEWIVRSFDQLPFMSDEAKRYYLPAYLRVAARDPRSTVAQFVLFELAADHRWQPQAGYTPAQRQAILAYLSLVEPQLDATDTDHLAAARRRWSNVT
jgi:hypothetical protein